MRDSDVRRLMTIPGVDMVVAVGVMAAIGRIERFPSAGHLSAYLGLHASLCQSGDGPAYHGRITKRGRSDARHLRVEAAWQTVRSPGPLRAFYERIKARRGAHVGAVAVARKLAVLIWHMLTKGEDYAWGRPTLLARKMELVAGAQARRGQCGSAYDYNHPDLRHADQAVAEHAEQVYRRLMQHWQRTRRRSLPAQRGDVPT